MPRDVTRSQHPVRSPDAGADGLRMIAGIATFLAVLWTFGGPLVGAFGTVEVVVEAVLWIAAVGLWLTVIVRRRQV